MSENHNSSRGNQDFSSVKQTLVVNGQTLPIFDGTIHVHWREAAATKKFTIVARVVDRYHLALRCHECGALTTVKRFVLMENKPLCSGCLQSKKLDDAAKAGLTFVRRDPTDRHYSFYAAKCGHELRRQIEFISKVATGQVELRCEICHLQRERAEAEVRGWALVGPDGEGDQNYRQYKDVAGCGHVQRIARHNMQSGRFSCHQCADNWLVEPSFLYLMRFEIPNDADVLKFGFSNCPDGRLNFQLQRRCDLPAEIVRVVPMPTGLQALRIEKKIHRHLKSNWPEMVVHAAVFRHVIRVKTEIYRLALLPQIHLAMDEAAGRQAA